jgi:large subunit ribosomal protein L6
MMSGVQEKFEYVVKICSSHFPMTFELNGNVAVVKNFLGEKEARTTELPEGVELDVKGEIITIKSADKELAGKTVSKLEKLTKIRGRDIRVFQDGLYLIKKNGKEI